MQTQSSSNEEGTSSDEVMRALAWTSSEDESDEAMRELARSQVNRNKETLTSSEQALPISQTQRKKEPPVRCLEYCTAKKSGRKEVTLSEDEEQGMSRHARKREETQERKSNQCHICMKSYKYLKEHLVKTHKLSPTKAKEKLQTWKKGKHP